MVPAIVSSVLNVHYIPIGLWPYSIDPGIDRVDRWLLESSRVDGEVESRVDRSSRSRVGVVESAEKTRRSRRLQVFNDFAPLGMNDKHLETDY